MLNAPIESMTQVSRNAQKIVAKEFTTIVAGVKTLSAAVPASSSASGPGAQADLKTKAKLAKALQALIADARGLKRKLEEASKQASKQARLCSHRLQYLRQVESLAEASKNGAPVELEGLDDDEASAARKAKLDAAAAAADGDDLSSSLPLTRKRNASAPAPASASMEVDTPSPSAAGGPARIARSGSLSEAQLREDEDRPFSVTPQIRVDRIFADHLLRSGRAQTAQLLLQTSAPALSALVDPDVFATARRIEASLLQQQDCTKALAWCGENRSRLAKLGAPLEFDLRLQEFLTLVKEKKTMEAIAYARKHLAPAAITTVTPAAAAEKEAGDEKQDKEKEKEKDKEKPATSAAGSKNNIPSVASASSSSSAAAAAGVEDKKGDDSSSSPQMVADPQRLKVLQEAMNLLIWGFEDSEDGDSKATDGKAQPWAKYRLYWSPTRFPELAREFRATHLAIYGLPPKSALEYVLNIGLGCIKTSSCQCTHCRQAQKQEEVKERATKAADSAKDAEMATDDAATAMPNAASAAAPSSSPVPSPSISSSLLPFPLLLPPRPRVQRASSLSPALRHRCRWLSAATRAWCAGSAEW